MDATVIMLGELIGPTMIVAGLGLLFNMKYMQNLMKDFAKNKALIFVMGVVTFVLGLAIVLNTNTWELSWKIVPTIIGWGALIKGTGFLIFPEAMMSLSSNIMKMCPKLLNLAGVIYIAAGVWVSYNVFM